MNTIAWIGLGSNLGDRKGQLDAAVAALREAPGVVVQAVSTYHQTRPVGGPPGQGAFLNASARLETTLDPHQLLAELQGVEDRADRVRVVRWGERTLDLDILIFGDKFLDTQQLKLPHPRLAFRRFVLAPLAEIAPELVDIITNRTISDLLANLDRAPKLLALDASHGERRSAVFRRLVEELPGFGISADDLERKAHRVGGPAPGPFELIARKAKALRAHHREPAALRVPWIVADFSLDLDLLRASDRGAWDLVLDVRDKPKLKTYGQAMRRARSAAKEAFAPTLIVMLPNQPALRRSPRLLEAPQLWPESDKPDPIVEEILATCRSIDEI